LENLMNFEMMNKDELLQVDGGILPAVVAVGIFVWRTTVVATAVVGAYEIGKELLNGE
jgi:lactobin A/cerein 7B family class IIb bacteriocin